MVLVISPAAAKKLREIPQHVARKIMEKMRAIAADPFATHTNAKALKGQPNAFRLRVGDWRAIYVIARAAQTVTLLDVLKREEAYR